MHGSVAASPAVPQSAGTPQKRESALWTLGVRPPFLVVTFAVHGLGTTFGSPMYNAPRHTWKVSVPRFKMPKAFRVSFGMMRTILVAGAVAVTPRPSTRTSVASPMLLFEPHWFVTVLPARNWVVRSTFLVPGTKKSPVVLTSAN